MIGGSGGAWPGNEGAKGVDDDVDGGVVDDGASGGLTQNGELVSPAARLAASPASRGGSTVRMKLSLNSAFSSGLLLLLRLRSCLAAMALASAPCMHEQKPSLSLLASWGWWSSIVTRRIASIAAS